MRRRCGVVVSSSTLIHMIAGSNPVVDRTFLLRSLLVFYRCVIQIINENHLFLLYFVSFCVFFVFFFVGKTRSTLPFM